MTDSSTSPTDPSTSDPSTTSDSAPSDSKQKPDPWAGFEKPVPTYPFRWLTFFDNWFEISKRGSSYARELIGGLTTFISMVYILTVNPNILSTAQPILWDSIFIATSLASFVSTCVMAFLPNVPFALSCGLGLNAQVMLYTRGFLGPLYTYGGAMTIVFLSGVIFLIITLVGFREYIFDAIPKSIKSAIPVGIGLFIAFIGLQNASIVVGGATLVTFVSIHDMYLDSEVRELAFKALVCFIGLFTICVLDHYRVKGCVFLGIVVAALIGIAFRVTPVENITKGWNIAERFKNFFSFDENKGGSFGLCFPGFKDAFSPGIKVPSTIVLIISYGMVDLFDTLGTVYGLGMQSNLLDKETGKCHNFSRVLFADCIGAVFGAIFGTSSVTTYLESSTGIAVGARTGLAAFFTAVLFLLSIFLSPIFFMIPDCATAPALIYVGVQMMSTVKEIDFTQIIEAIPVFMTIIMMPLTYSITNGMCIGVITYSVVHIIRFLIDCVCYCLTGKVFDPEKVEPVEPEAGQEKEKGAEGAAAAAPAGASAGAGAGAGPSTEAEAGTDTDTKAGSADAVEAIPSSPASDAPVVEDLSSAENDGSVPRPAPPADSTDGTDSSSASVSANAATAAAPGEGTAPAPTVEQSAATASAAAAGDEKKDDKPATPVWPINIGLGVITILFALTVFLPTKFKNN